MANTNIGKGIRQARILRKLSQAQLAQKLGVTKQTISNYENNVREPDFEMLDTLAAVLGVSLSYLVGETDEPVSYPSSYDPSDTDAPWQEREALRDDPDRRALLDLARNGSPEDVRQVAAIIDALRATNPAFYDGDDPA